MMTDQQYMTHALELAARGIGKTSPNPVVGCVIVKQGKIIGEGWHRKCGGSHAEVAALRQAGADARGAVMYVTLEPCSHQGRTPPCVDLVMASGIKRVVIAMIDPNPKVRGRSAKKMRWSGIEVETGCLKEDAMALNRPFCKWIRTGLPFVTAKIAQTLDGKTASFSGHSRWITSSAARRYTHQLRNDYDAILVGVNTALSDDPELNPAGQKPHWTKIVLDSRLRVPLNAALFKRFKTMIATTTKAPAQKIRRLEKQGVEVVVCPLKNNQVDLMSLLKKLGQREIANLLIEGGAHVIGSALNEQAVDRILTVIAPKILGDQRALSAVSGLNILDVNRAVCVDVEETRQIGGDWIFEGTVLYSQR